MKLSSKALAFLNEIYGSTSVSLSHLGMIKREIRSDYDDYTETEQNAADEIIDYIDNVTIDFTKELEK